MSTLCSLTFKYTTYLFPMRAIVIRLFSLPREQGVNVNVEEVQ